MIGSSALNAECRCRSADEFGSIDYFGFYLHFLIGHWLISVVGFVLVSFIG